jgi:CDP-4-dehydro-6-deoxyglucose reductase
MSNQGATISLQDGTKFPISRGQTLLSAAMDAGVLLEHSCRDGRCGNCKATVVRGHALEIASSKALTADEKQNSTILTCTHGATEDLEVDILALPTSVSLQARILPCRISDLKKLSSDVISVSLRLPPSVEFEFLAGQHIDIIRPGGLRRSYSIASSPNNPKGTIDLLIRNYLGGEMSKYWFEEAKIDDLLRFEGPLGTFFFRQNKPKNIAFLATGTGIAPIMAMINEINHGDHKRWSGEAVCYFGCRTKSELFFDPDQIFGNGFSSPKIVFSREASNARDLGYVQNALLTDFGDMTSFTVYACGSPDMISSARQLLQGNGLVQKNFYYDAFLAAK